MTPERIKAWPWTGKSNSGQWHVAGIGETTEYVRADLFAAQAAELATLRAERDAAIERCAAWHDRDAIGAMNSLHCGSENSEYRAANRLHDFHKSSADAIRALKGGA